MTKKLEDYHALASSRGFKWVSTELPKDTLTPTEWECSKGHRWIQRYNALYRGHGCPECCVKKASSGLRKRMSSGHRLKKRITEQDYYNKAKALGFLWVGSVPPTGVIGNTAWSCNLGHVWEESYHHIASRACCPVCMTLKTDERYKYAENEYNLQLLHKPRRIDEKSTWKCEKNHIFKMSLSSIENQTLLLPKCPICKETRVPEQRYRDVANARGFEWLGPFPARVEYKTKWKCPKGHVWDAPLSNIGGKIQSGCPVCAKSRTLNGHRISYIQEKLAKQVADSTLNYPVRRYTIDIAVVCDKIAIEYDTFFWHREVIDASTREHKKNKTLLEEGWKIIRIRSNNKLPNNQQLKEAISRAKDGQPYQEIVLDDWGPESSFGFVK